MSLPSMGARRKAGRLGDFLSGIYGKDNELDKRKVGARGMKIRRGQSCVKLKEKVDLIEGCYLTRNDGWGDRALMASLPETILPSKVIITGCARRCAVIEIRGR